MDVSPVVASKVGPGQDLPGTCSSAARFGPKTNKVMITPSKTQVKKMDNVWTIYRYQGRVPELQLCRLGLTVSV